MANVDYEAILANHDRKLARLTEKKASIEKKISLVKANRANAEAEQKASLARAEAKEKADKAKESAAAE